MGYVQFLMIFVFVAAIATPCIRAQQVTTATKSTEWQVKFTPVKLETTMGSIEQVELEITNINTAETESHHFKLKSDDEMLATVEPTTAPNAIQPNENFWRGNITITAIFLGKAKIFVERINLIDNSSEINKNALEVIITRRMRTIDYVFTGSVILLVSLLYINFGAALDLQALRGLVRRPVGPSIGFLTQFLLMPLLSYGLGVLIFPNSYEMQLGLFFTGVSPGGGASNIWTVILNGNINLSVLMTAIGNFAAFGTMPLWLFTLGQLIFERADMHVPYQNIATLAVSLIVPLAIGLSIQRWSPRTTQWLVRLLKPLSTCLILFIIIFAIITNLYIFQLFSWQIVVAGLALPWLGYIFAFIVAKTLRQNSKDALTIAIETGLQNTGISIFLLKLSLPQPEADLTTVIPVSVAIMTPFPLLALYIYQKCTARGIKDALMEETHINANQQDQARIIEQQNHSNVS